MKINKILKKLGFKDFQAYKKSEHYTAALELKGEVCKNCGKEATSIYFDFPTEENLKGETAVGVWAVCANCLNQINRVNRVM